MQIICWLLVLFQVLELVMGWQINLDGKNFSGWWYVTPRLFETRVGERAGRHDDDDVKGATRVFQTLSRPSINFCHMAQVNAAMQMSAASDARNK